MTSGAYLSLACDGLGFWESGEKRTMQMMQLDFASEVRPGTALRYERGESGGVRYLRRPAASQMILRASGARIGRPGHCRSSPRQSFRPFFFFFC